MQGGGGNVGCSSRPFRGGIYGGLSASHIGIDEVSFSGVVGNVSETPQLTAHVRQLTTEDFKSIPSVRSVIARVRPALS